MVSGVSPGDRPTAGVCNNGTQLGRDSEEAAANKSVSWVTKCRGPGQGTGDALLTVLRSPMQVLTLLVSRPRKYCQNAD